MRVAIFFNARRSQGGLYQYAASLVHSLSRFETRHHYTLFHATFEPPPPCTQRPGFEVVTLPRSSVAMRMGAEAALMEAARRGLARTIRVVPRFREITQARPDVILHVKPSVHVFQWPEPAIFPIHDLQHFFQREFPEVAHGGEFERRQYLYRNAVPAARIVLADSDVGREDIIQVYGKDPARVRSLPHLSPTYLTTEVTAGDLERVRARYQPPDGFIFYPAMFWPHKNHARLLAALAILRRIHGVSVPLLLAGGKNHEYARLVELTASLGLTEEVQFLGRVPDEDMFPLYRLALALVMPTFFGPSNLPNIEAWSMDCPLITSDIRGLREQVGDAGVLADPREPLAIAEAIWRVREDAELRRRLIDSGRRRVQAWTPEDFAARLAAIIDDV